MTPPAPRRFAAHRAVPGGTAVAYETVAAALAAADPGDTVLLAPGVHRERLRLDRDVTLRAATGPQAPAAPSNPQAPTAPADPADPDGGVSGVVLTAPGTRTGTDAEPDAPVLEVAPGVRAALDGITVRGTAGDRPAVVLSGGACTWTGGGGPGGRRVVRGDATATQRGRAGGGGGGGGAAGRGRGAPGGPGARGAPPPPPPCAGSPCAARTWPECCCAPPARCASTTACSTASPARAWSRAATRPWRSPVPRCAR
ncbi:hypothetical protein ACFW9F_20160 [Streptomyces sp. NPDC059506]|uniref:hypothetical protein n=1 Tax=Streptomyces sp. NPDC059506 TaxID=3347751 RepID=UPI0036C582B9